MGDGTMDDGFELPANGSEFDHGVGGEAADGGLDVDLQFLDDVESMDLEGMGGATATEPTSEPAPATDGMTAEDVAEFRARWADLQASFIDDPHRACEQADNLVDRVLTRLMERFAKERDHLVRSWDRGAEATDTEELRMAMKGYRSLIDRLLEAEL